MRCLRRGCKDCQFTRALPEVSIDGKTFAIPGILFDIITAAGQIVSNSALADLRHPSSRASQFVIESIDLALKHRKPYPSSPPWGWPIRLYEGAVPLISDREISLLDYSLTLGDVDSKIDRPAYIEKDGI